MVGILGTRAVATSWRKVQCADVDCGVGEMCCGGSCLPHRK